MSPTPQERFRWRFRWRFGWLAGLLACGLAACQGDVDAPPAAAPAARSWTLPVIEAATGAAPEQPSAGAVVSQGRVEIGSRIGGRIAELRVQEGDVVHRGQLLVRLEAAEVDGGIRQAQAGVSAAQAAWRDASTDLERFQALESRGSVSNNEMRKVRLRQEAAQQTLNQASAALDTAAAQRNQTSLQSPIDGVVVSGSRQVGDLAMPGQPLLVLEAQHGLLFETRLPESRVSAIRPGQEAEVVLDGQPAPLKGSVLRVLPSSDAVARQHTVKISLPAASGLAAGQFGRVSFRTAPGSAVVVPRTALVERGGLRGVFVLDADHRARFRWLRTGREWGDRVEVTAGLQPGERILAGAEAALREGDTVVAMKAQP